MPAAKAKPSATPATREKLITAAESLFAQYGFRGVSVRMIAAAAEVNWSLLRYHFNDKEGLLAEIYRRHCSVLNAQRMRLLEEANVRANPPKLEEVIEAFVRPALAVARDGSFSRLRAILAAEDSELLEHLVAENFDSSSTIFIKALAACVPEVPRDEILWRFHFMLGTIYYSASGPHRIKTFSQGRCDPGDVEATVLHIVPFLAAAFRSGSVEKSGRKRR